MGAWGVEPFENDSALDWLSRIQREVERAFKPALKPLRKQKVHRRVGPAKQHVIGGKRVSIPQMKLVERLTLPGNCQEAALAAVQLVLALPALQQTRIAPDYVETIAQRAEKVLLNLKQDEAFIGIWFQPKKYVAVLDRELRRVRKILDGQKQEHELVIKRQVLRIRKMPEAERRRIAAGKFARNMLHTPTFREAFKRVTGKDVPAGTLAPKRNPRRRLHTKKR